MEVVLDTKMSSLDLGSQKSIMFTAFRIRWTTVRLCKERKRMSGERENAERKEKEKNWMEREKEEEKDVGTG